MLGVLVLHAGFFGPFVDSLNAAGSVASPPFFHLLLANEHDFWVLLRAIALGAPLAGFPPAFIVVFFLFELGLFYFFFFAYLFFFLCLFFFFDFFFFFFFVFSHQKHSG